MIPEEKIVKVLQEIIPAELIGLASDLVKMNSVWDPEAGTGEQKVAEFLAAWGERQGFEVALEKVVPGRSNTIIRWSPAPGEKTLMFEGHTDVVTPGDVAVWKHDYLGAEIIEGRMYGRGTNDTKGNLAALLIAMAALKRSGVALEGTIIGGVLCDEEGQMLGVQDFIRRGHADTVSGAIICEPEDGLICTSQKGAVRAAFTITGRMSHGAMPLSGLNTAPAVSMLIHGLHELELSSIKKLGHDADLGWPSFTPTVIQSPVSGPPQLNVMPGEARVLVDIRTIPGQHHPDILDDLAQLVSSVEKQTTQLYENYDRLIDLERERQLKIRLDILTDRPCTQTGRHDPVVQAADWATRRITGSEPVYAGVPGATDGTFLWALKDIPIVTMGAGDRQVPHQVDEWVDLDQLVETAKIYALAALHYLYPRSTS